MVSRVDELGETETRSPLVFEDSIFGRGRVC